MSVRPTQSPQRSGLILSGGGARAAYQVGVLLELAAMRRVRCNQTRNPFDVICGTSSGAINASALACGSDQFDQTLNTLANVWENFHVNQVYRSDVLDMVRSGARWLSLITLGWTIRAQNMRPKSLLDNTPLANLLSANIDFSRLPQLLAQGHLQALAITASNYSSGEHVTFYQSGRDIPPWVRNQRMSMHCEIGHQHLLASSGIPFLFPAARLEGPDGVAWFGDGAMRQSAPISPAIHLGAEKILAIGVGRIYEPRHSAPVDASDYPSMASIAGVALSSIFLDALPVDIERLERVNKMLQLIPPADRSKFGLKPIDLLVISPSERLDDIALRHAAHLPATVQKLLHILGSSPKKGSGQSGAFISYLLFESTYTQELIALGRSDARAKADEIHRFFNWC